MPQTTPLPDWKGEEVYVVGGGPSLKTFPWDKLCGRLIIGCNQAALLLPDICDICVWGDLRFWNAYADRLAKFPGWVVTNLPGVMSPPAWLRQFTRLDTGLSLPGSGVLGWNNNTGALGVALALYMGAVRVHLLGFDMQFASGPQDAHWHAEGMEVQTEAHYRKFREGFDGLAAAAKQLYPGVAILNVTDGSSQLRTFPNVHPNDLFPDTEAAAA